MKEKYINDLYIAWINKLYIYDTLYEYMSLQAELDKEENFKGVHYIWIPQLNSL